MSQLRLWMAAALAAYALATTGMWADLSAAFLGGAGRSYEENRTAFAFRGIPIGAIGRALDQQLEPGASVALSDTLFKDDFARQRLTEGLYPRALDQTAARKLDFDRAQGALLLDGAPLAPAPDGPDTRAPLFVEDLSLAPLAFLGALLSAAGYGMAAWMLLFRRTALHPLVFGTVVTLLSCLFLTLVTTATTWLQVRIFWPALGVGGLVALAGAIVYGITTRRITTGAADHIRAMGRHWETWALGALLTVFLVREASFPVTLWDGRSIWFFQAKRLFFQGMLAKSDLAMTDALWSHADYPLLFPTWLAHFTSFSGRAYNERLASLGIPVLLSSLTAGTWYLSRALLGRWPGAALTLAAFLSVEFMSAGGYADGLLMMMLLLSFFAFASGEHAILGWLAAAAASLTKSEGLVLAPLVVIMFHRRPMLFAVFLPAVLHKFWLKAQGLDSILKGSSPIDALTLAVERLGALLGEIPAVLAAPGYTRARMLLWAGLAGLAAAALIPLFTRKAPRTALLALAAGAAFVAFALGSISLLPEDARWFAHTALDRLLLHPSALFLSAAFLLVSGRR